MLSRTEIDRKDSQIEFVSSHHPAFSPGDYTLRVSQSLEITAPEARSETYSGKPQMIRVQPPDTRLNPQQIRTLFPPEGSLGEYSQNLPHIVLTPSTLPWEKNALRTSDSGEQPWLALILFTEEEFAQVEQGSLTSGGPNRPDAAIIAVPTNLLGQLMPPLESLKFLNHVRQKLDAHGKIEGDEVAVVMGCRLPAAGNNIVHLVAIDGQYSDSGFDPNRGAQNNKKVLITLKSWRFASIDPRFGFEQLLKGLDRGFIEHLPTNNEIANRYLRMGASLVPHYMRQGNKSASWYRGPLVPGYHAISTEVAFPVRSADDLVFYNEEIGLFDVSYAVAWELGRLLMLNSKGVAFDLYHWKQGNAQRIKSAEQQIDHLPFAGPSVDLNLPSSVVSWFKRAALLDGVPFHNLVIDEKLLPEESIRFFEIDWHWIEALLDGAFSVGRVTALDHHRERLLEKASAKLPERRMTGFLLRSAVVAGHPDLQVDAFTRILPLNGAETEIIFATSEENLGYVLSQAANFQQDAIIEVQNLFLAHGQILSQGFTVDPRAWFITVDDNPAFEVSQAANDKLAVREYNAQTQSFTDKGQIGAEFALDLGNGRFSKPLVRAMAQIEIELKEFMGVIGSRWLLSDPDGGVFLVEHDGDTYIIFHEYRNPLLRLEQLSKNILLGIFEGRIKTLDFHLKPEVLHHGFHNDNSGGLIKYKKDVAGREQFDSQPVAVSFLENAAARTIDIVKLVQDLVENQEAGEFALQMIEGVPKIRFVIGSSEG